jgi:hypothetical protein
MEQIVVRYHTKNGTSCCAASAAPSSPADDFRVGLAQKLNKYPMNRERLHGASETRLDPDE